MSPLTALRALFISLPLFLLSARAAVVNATFNSSSDVAVTAASYTATGNTVNLTLNFAPEVGTNLTVVNNTGLPFIQGTFGNLAQGQKVALTYGGIGYNFVANYYGGTGNDLVLQWAENRVFAWGYNYGRLGDGTSTNRTLPTPVVSSGVLADKTVVAVAVGTNHSIALCSDGSLATWGFNDFGQIGDSTTTNRTSPVAVQMSGVLFEKTVIAIAAGDSHTLALCSDGSVAAWGKNYYGTLGNNSTADSTVPVLVNTAGPLAGRMVVAITAGSESSFALCSDGTMVAWGLNSGGQLGDGSKINSLTPVTVSDIGVLSGKMIVAMAAGNDHCLVLSSDGLVYSWGQYGNGALGNTAYTQGSSVPVAVSTAGLLSGKFVSAISAGYSHSLALCSDNTLTSWGNNGQGELGNNSNLNSGIPVAVYASSALAGKSVTQIAGGGLFSLALCSDGTLATWGYNSQGQLGNGTTSNSLTPSAANTSLLASNERLTAVAGGSYNHSLAIAASPQLPFAATTSPTSLTSSSATLNGTVNANFNSTVVSFQYGLTTSYGNTITASQSPVTGNTDTAVSANISGLVAGTTYHYRVVATNALGATTGADMTFIAASNNANLSGLTLGTGSFTPTFNANTTDYIASVSNTTLSATIRPTLADTTATARVNGIVVSSGTYSGAINLAVGPNVITVEVTAQDAITVKTYTVTVTRLSANADLASLVPSAGALSPDFGAATTSYTSSVPYSATSLTLTPTVADGTATVKVNGTLVASGSASNAITLNVGNNTFTILVHRQ